MDFRLSLLLSLVTVVVVVSGDNRVVGVEDEQLQGPLLSSFTQQHQQVSRNSDGSYRFTFSLPYQTRTEERDAFGRVTGEYAYVDKLGKEVSVQYEADHFGFRPRSDAIPQPPQETEDVVRAREEFFRHYQATAELLRELESSEEGESSSEESDEEGESSSEESDEDGEESDEEDSDEDSSSEEDEEEEEDDEEEEEEGGEEEENEGEEDEYQAEDEEVENKEAKEEKTAAEPANEERPDSRGLYRRVVQAIPVSLKQRTGRRAIFTPLLLPGSRQQKNIYGRRTFQRDQRRAPEYSWRSV